jgi:hypothetical protein
MNDEMENLFEKYLQKRLSAAERRMLAQALEQDEAVRTRFVDYLVWAGRFSQAVARLDQAQAESRPGNAPAGRAHGWGFFARRVAIPLAAAAALIIGVYGLNVWQAERGDRSRVTGVEGNVARIQDAGRRIQDSGFRIQNSEWGEIHRKAIARRGHH